MLGGAIEKAARSRHIVRGRTLVVPGQSLKIEVDRFGVRSLFRTSRLGSEELGRHSACKPRDDFALHLEQIGHGLVEPLGPEMISALRVDQLDIDAHPISAALNAALQDITNVQLAADLLQIDVLAFVGEGRVSANHERAADARQVRCQALSHAVHEIFLLRVAADIGEGQDDDREARRGGFFGAAAVAGFACAGLPASSE